VSSSGVVRYKSQLVGVLGAKRAAKVNARAISPAEEAQGFWCSVNKNNKNLKRKSDIYKKKLIYKTKI